MQVVPQPIIEPYSGKDGETTNEAMKPRSRLHHPHGLVRALVRNLPMFSSYDRFQLADSGDVPEERKKLLTKPRAPWTYMVVLLISSILLGAELVVNGFEFEPLTVNPSFGPSVETLIKLGARKTDLILTGEWYRLFTSIFLHAGLFHYAANMFALYIIQGSDEEIFGHFAVAYVFIVSGFFSMVISSIFSPGVVGVGASGAVFGYLGAAWSELIMNWSLYRDKKTRQVRKLLLATVVNFLLGFCPHLDQHCHIGGFVAGFLTGFSVLISDRYNYQGKLLGKKRYQKILQAASVVLTPTMVLGALLFLFLEMDPEKYCPWCQYLSCYPFPPGDNPWWTCDGCNENVISALIFPNGTAVVSCPGGQSKTLLGSLQPNTEPTSDVALFLCQQYC